MAIYTQQLCAGVQDSVSGSEIHSISIPIRKNGITNNTKVRCVAVLLQGNNEMNSQNGTIIIQGLIFL